MDDDLITLIAEDCGVEGYIEDLQAFAKRIRAYERIQIANEIGKMPGDTAASIAVWVRDKC